MARAAADGDDLPGASAAVGGGDDDGRRGRTLTVQGTRAGATTTACNQINIYKIKK